MQLTEHRPDEHWYIHSLHDDFIRVVETDWRESLLISGDKDPEAWPVPSVDALTRDQLQPVLDYRPDIFLLATGRRMRFPDRELQLDLLRHAIGLEVMTLQAAARTFNILAGEGRRVMAGLIWEPGGSG